MYVPFSLVKCTSQILQVARIKLLDQDTVVNPKNFSLNSDYFLFDTGLLKQVSILFLGISHVWEVKKSQKVSHIVLWSREKSEKPRV